MAALSNVQISSIARLHYHTKDYFGGCFCTDTLPLYVPKYPCCIVCNSAPSYTGGEHWLAICVQSRHHKADFYDSMGEDITQYDDSLLRFIERNSNGDYNYTTHMYQSEHSSVCGHFALWFIDQRCKNVPFEKCFQVLDKGDSSWNDYYVTEYVMQHMRPGYV